MIAPSLRSIQNSWPPLIASLSGDFRSLTIAVGAGAAGVASGFAPALVAGVAGVGSALAGSCSVVGAFAFGG
ncbi:MAG: hypothetical protein HYV09_00055 [Deltaproteobacteria bacterium]|nr:hypothetical protein [Deltaproteobacteria bacterium]